MEPKFVNLCTQTEAHLREMMFASMGRWRIILYTAVGAFAILTGILILAAGTLDSGIILILMGALLLMLAYLRPFLAARQQFRRNKVLTDGKELTPTELKFYDDRVVTSNATVEKEVTFTYDKFKKLRVTKHLYLIKLPENLWLLVERGGFIVGNSADFPNFIQGIIKK
ncbi:MAG: hypothetical protein E7632_11720 [Ruminococcaceae bacterium]|nr:hypothetical protein [Oscillospiraceae bacterium]